jgi:hypothetical protein
VFWEAVLDYGSVAPRRRHRLAPRKQRPPPWFETFWAIESRNSQNRPSLRITHL